MRRAGSPSRISDREKRLWTLLNSQEPSSPNGHADRTLKESHALCRHLFAGLETAARHHRRDAVREYFDRLRMLTDPAESVLRHRLKLSTADMIDEFAGERKALLKVAARLQDVTRIAAARAGLDRDGNTPPTPTRRPASASARSACTLTPSPPPAQSKRPGSRADVWVPTPPRSASGTARPYSVAASARRTRQRLMEQSCARCEDGSLVCAAVDRVAPVSGAEVLVEVDAASEASSDRVGVAPLDSSRIQRPKIPTALTAAERSLQRFRRLSANSAQVSPWEAENRRRSCAVERRRALEAVAARRSSDATADTATAGEGAARRRPSVSATGKPRKCRTSLSPADPQSPPAGTADTVSPARSAGRRSGSTTLQSHVGWSPRGPVASSDGASDGDESTDRGSRSACSRSPSTAAGMGASARSTTSSPGKGRRTFFGAERARRAAELDATRQAEEDRREREEAARQAKALKEAKRAAGARIGRWLLECIWWRGCLRSLRARRRLQSKAATVLQRTGRAYSRRWQVAQISFECRTATRIQAVWRSCLARGVMRQRRADVQECIAKHEVEDARFLGLVLSGVRMYQARTTLRRRRATLQSSNATRLEHENDDTHGIADALEARLGSIERQLAATCGPDAFADGLSPSERIGQRQLELRNARHVATWAVNAALSSSLRQVDARRRAALRIQCFWRSAAARVHLLSLRARDSLRFLMSLDSERSARAAARARIAHSVGNWAAVLAAGRPSMYQ